MDFVFNWGQDEDAGSGLTHEHLVLLNNRVAQEALEHRKITDQRMEERLKTMSEETQAQMEEMILVMQERLRYVKEEMQAHVDARLDGHRQMTQDLIGRSGENAALLLDAHRQGLEDRLEQALGQVEAQYRGLEEQLAALSLPSQPGEQRERIAEDDLQDCGTSDKAFKLLERRLADLVKQEKADLKRATSSVAVRLQQDRQQREASEKRLEQVAEACRRTAEEARGAVDLGLADHASQLRGLREELERRRPPADDVAAGVQQSLVELRARVEGMGRNISAGVQPAEGAAAGADSRGGAGTASEPTNKSSVEVGGDLVSTGSRSVVAGVLTGSQRTSLSGESYVKVTPFMIDCSDMYELRESIWDAMFVVGHHAIGRFNTYILGVVFLVNFVLQALFIVLIHALLMEPMIDSTILDGLLKFRLGLAHMVDYADKVTGRSMASQICSFDRKLHLAGEQVIMYRNLWDFYAGGVWSKVLIFFIQVLWLCTIMEDLDQTYSIIRAVFNIRTGRKTLLVHVDKRDDEDAVRPSKTLEREGGISGAQQLDGSMTVVRCLSMTTKRKVAITLCVCLPKVLLACLLYPVGAMWLANTIDFTELILNAVALAFVLDFDEVLYSVLAPRRSRTLLSHLEPLPYRQGNPGSPWHGKRSLLMASLMIFAMLFLYFAVLERRFWELDQGHQVVCSGNTDFVYTVNPASGMVHIAYTTGANTYTDTEEIIAQVARVNIQEHDWWDGLVSQDIFDASVSDFARAVTETGSDPFGQITELSHYTLAEAANYLPCQDLASGESEEASLETLRILMQDPTILSCHNIPRIECSLMANTRLRAICPNHCRCEESLLGGPGFFQNPEYGCPIQCQTFKASKNEISFRFALSYMEDTGSARRLQSAAPGQATGPAGRRLTMDEAINLTSASISAVCADFADTDFGFRGGCADSNGVSQLDRNGNDCSSYTTSWECGQADDDDFLAAELCCSCGGGIADVPSSVDCYDNFRRVCWDMPWKALSWLLWVRGLFEYSLSKPGFRDTVASVVDADYAGIAPEYQTAQDLVDYISDGSLGRALANGSWDLMPGLGHPRGLSGCDYLVSYEITSLLNIDLCADGIHTPIRFFCPNACGCSTSNGLAECPAACVFAECLEGLQEGSCSHVHPWYSSECIAGFHNDNVSTCFKCVGGETRRRRSTSCTECADGFYDMGNADDCLRCSGGRTRRRRSTSCTHCDDGAYDADDSDDCTQCVGGTTTRRRSTTCTDCPIGTWNSGAWDDCQPTASCETRRRRSFECLDCPPGYYNDASSDDCSRCEGGETRRRRDAVSCTACPNGTYADDGYDECLPVGCPNHSSGGSVADGCSCDAGYVGQIRPTSQEPYYSGACTELSFYTQSSGFCAMNILDADLCAYGALKLGLSSLSAEESAIENTALKRIFGCSVIAGGQPIIAPFGNYPCSKQPGDCVCLGNESDFVCADASDTISSYGNSSCPPSHDVGPEEDWNQGCLLGVGEATPAQCCSCKNGGVWTKQPHPTCNDTNGEATSGVHTVTGLRGCVLWDWFPSKCQWSSYYDDDDFTAADMCCACGGGNGT